MKRFCVYVLFALGFLYSGAFSYWAYGSWLPKLSTLSFLGLENPFLPLSLTGGAFVPLFSQEGFDLFRVVPFGGVLMLALFGNRLLSACSVLWALGFVGHAYGLILPQMRGFTGYHEWLGPEAFYGLQLLAVTISGWGLQRAHSQRQRLLAYQALLPGSTKERSSASTPRKPFLVSRDMPLADAEDELLLTQVAA